MGTYAITPSAATFSSGSSSNYSTITYSAGSFSITKAALTVTPTAGQSVTYGTSSPTYAFTVSGFKNSETTSTAAGYVAPTCSASGYSATLAAASTFTISCSGGSATNYSFVTTATTSATVSQAQLTVSPTSQSLTYGDAVPTYTFAVNGWKNSENAGNATSYVAPTCTSAYTRTSPAGTPVAITCSGGSATNYSFSYGSSNITIAKAGTLTITAASPSAISYGAATPANSITTTGKMANDVIASVTYTYAGTNSTTYGPSTSAPTLPGTYSITPSAAVFAANSGALTNYTTVTYVAGSLSINKPVLVITASIGGSSVVYGTSFTETYTVSNIISGHVISGLTYTYTGTGSTVYGPSTSAPTAVGTYAITPSAATFSSGSSSNYSTITYSAGSFSITKAALQIIPDTVTVTYGDPIPLLTFSVSGLKYGQSINSIDGYVPPACSTTYSPTTQVAASPVSVTCSGGSSTNYTFTSATQSGIYISRKALNITGTTINSRTYNGTTTPGTIVLGTLSGLVNGENLGISATASNFSNSSPGTYPTNIAYSLLNTANGLANNYSLAGQALTGTISPATPGFNVALSQGSQTSFQVNYGNAEALTITATTDTTGTVNFNVGINGGAPADISGCASISTSAGAAVCQWMNPTIGNAHIVITMTPTDSTNQSIDPKSIDTVIVAKPYITTFTVKNQSTKSGPAGSTVIITGGNFTGITSIKFNGIEAEKTFRATSTQATVTVPLGATTGQISITTQFGGTCTSTDSFTVLP